MENPHRPKCGVRVSAPSRLHFGLLSFGHPHERQFGGVGVMVDQPRVEVVVTPDKEFVVQYGPLARRIADVVQTWSRRRLSIRHPLVRISLEASGAAHSGLGTGTQLALALATALNHCYELEPDSAENRALSVDRGLRSAVGTYGFFQGGMIVELGREQGQKLAPLWRRLGIPESWRFLLIQLVGPTGRSGIQEQKAFACLPPVPTSVTKRLAQILMDRLVPAAESESWEDFGDAVYEYGRLAGGCFSAEQGGFFASPQISAVVDFLRSEGIPGVGQSSWGPTVFAILNSEHDADAIRQRLHQRFPAAIRNMSVAYPDNRGAQVNSQPWSG